MKRVCDRNQKDNLSEHQVSIYSVESALGLMRVQKLHSVGFMSIRSFSNKICLLVSVLQIRLECSLFKQ